MTTYAIQRLSQCSEEERVCHINDGQEVTIGAAFECDLRLHISFGLPDISVKIRLEDALCVVENLTPDALLVLVNGQGVYGVAQLQDGDALQIGSDQFAVLRVPSESVAAKVAETRAPGPPAAASINRGLEATAVNAAVSRHTPVDPRWDEAEVLERLCDEHDAFLLANFRHASVDVPRVSVAGEDHYQEMPEEVRAIYSLHAITGASANKKLKIYDGLRDQDAAVWVLPEADIDLCLKDAQIHLAWFARPSVLEMTLQESPPMFIEALFKPFKAIIVKPQSGPQQWVMYTKADFDPVELGICEAVPV